MSSEVIPAVFLRVCDLISQTRGCSAGGNGEGCRPNPKLCLLTQNYLGCTYTGKGLLISIAVDTQHNTVMHR
jgi:hypothetical protein